MVQTSPLLLIDFYAGAYGPTLRMDVQTRAALIELHRVLGSLARAKPGVTVALGEAFRGSLSGPNLLLTVTPKRGVNCLTRKGDASFEWTADIEGWSQSADLLDGLVRSGGPGHQYFADGSGAQLPLEIAFQESVDEHP